MRDELKQINELIRRNYRVPRFIDISIDSPAHMMPEHIELKSVLLPLLKEHEKLLRQRHYLVDILSCALGPGWTYPYWDNPRKQKLIDEISAAIPEFRWPIMYEIKDQPERGEREEK